MLLWCLAAWVRLGWSDLCLDVDWSWFLRLAGELGTGQSTLTPPADLYTSVPALGFGLLARLVDDPADLLRAWGVVGAAVVPVVYLGVRRLSGVPAGLAAGAVVALSSADIYTSVGLMSPYAISLMTALAALGLVAGSQGRVWGPTLLIGGTALAVSHHIGLWPTAPVAALLALLHLMRMPRRRGLLGGAAALLAGGAVLGFVLGIDGSHLWASAQEYGGRHPSQLAQHGALGAAWALGQGAAEIVLDPNHRAHPKLLCALNTTPWGLGLLGAAVVLGLVLGVPRWVRSRSTAHGGTAAGLALGVLIQLLLWAVAGVSPYLEMALARGRLDVHHLVAFLPMAVVLLAAALTALSPANPRVAWVLPAAALGVWIGLDETDKKGSRCGALERGRVLAPTCDPLIRLSAVAPVAQAIRADSQGRRPVVYAWIPFRPQKEPGLFVHIAGDLALLGADATGQAHACYLAASHQDLSLLPGLRVLDVEGGQDLGLVAFDDCAELTALDPVLCAPDSPNTVWRHRWAPMSSRKLLSCGRNEFLP